MPDIGGIPYVESSDLVSGWPTVSQSVAQEVSDQLASKLPYSYGTATPSTTDSGFLWYDSNSTPPVPKYWNGSSFATLAPAPGLELVTAETFSAVSSVSINACFTSSYAHYKIVMQKKASAGGTNTVRLRSSGTDDSSANYNRYGFTFGTNLGANSQSSFIYGYQRTNYQGYVWDFMGPNLADNTQILGVSLDSGNGFVAFSGNLATSSQYDGFTLLTDAGNMTGTIRVYGYKD